MKIVLQTNDDTNEPGPKDGRIICEETGEEIESLGIEYDPRSQSVIVVLKIERIDPWH